MQREPLLKQRVYFNSASETQRRITPETDLNLPNLYTPPITFCNSNAGRGNGVNVGFAIAVRDILQNSFFNTHPEVNQVSEDADKLNVSLFDLAYIAMSAACISALTEHCMLFYVNEDRTISSINGNVYQKLGALLHDPDIHSSSGHTKGYTFNIKEEQIFNCEVSPIYALSVLEIIPPKIERGNLGIDFIATPRKSSFMTTHEISVKSVPEDSSLLDKSKKNYLKQIGKLIAFLSETSNSRSSVKKVVFYIPYDKLETSLQVTQQLSQNLQEKNIDLSRCIFISTYQLNLLGIQLAQFKWEPSQDFVRGLKVALKPTFSAKWLAGIILSDELDNIFQAEEMLSTQRTNRNNHMLLRPECIIFDLVPELRTQLHTLYEILGKKLPPIVANLDLASTTQWCDTSPLFKRFINDIRLRIKITMNDESGMGSEVKFLRNFFTGQVLNNLPLVDKT
jgi:hypothetical protein